MIKKTLIASSVALLSGCAYIPDKFSPDYSVMDNETVPDEVSRSSLDSDRNLPSIEYRKAGSDEYFKISRMDDNDPIPDVDVMWFSVNNASVYDTLRILLLDVGINLSMSHETANKTGMYMTHGKGSLPHLVEQIADASDLFYRHKNNTLSFRNKESFVFKIPPMLDEETREGVKLTLESLGAQGVSIDSRFNAVTFEATRNKLKAIEDYLKNVSKSGSVIIYDTWIWEVSLNESNRAGVKWEDFSYMKGNTAIDISGGGDIGDLDSATDLIGGIAHATENFSLNMLVSFLKKHGSLSTLSHPKISLMSGSNAKLEVGEEVKYVSELTSTVSTTGDTTQSSAETETLSTGLKLNIRGAFESESVYSKIGLEISDLLRFNEFTASGTVLSLPHTMIRKVETDTRMEPGEYFILGGVNMSRKQNDDTGTPSLFGKAGIGMPLSKADSMEKSELVIVMRPRVIVFDESPEQKRAEQAVKARASSTDKTTTPKETDA